jgi:hypothetical protein
MSQPSEPPGRLSRGPGRETHGSFGIKGEAELAAAKRPAARTRFRGDVRS